jgi:hypothetical protein
MTSMSDVANAIPPRSGDAGAASGPPRAEVGAASGPPGGEVGAASGPPPGSVAEGNGPAPQFIFGLYMAMKFDIHTPWSSIATLPLMNAFFGDANRPNPDRNVSSAPTPNSRA